MKKQEFNELKTKPVEELQKFLRELKERGETLRFDLAQGKVKNIRELRGVKKSIAQILTILSEISKQDSSAKKSQ